MHIQMYASASTPVNDGGDVLLHMKELSAEARCSTSIVRKEKNFQIAVTVVGQLTSMLVKKAADT